MYTLLNPLQGPARPFQLAELIHLGVHHLLWQASEFSENLQLQLLRHPRQFGGAHRIKNNLKWRHVVLLEAEVADAIQTFLPA
jgi:hypothetical protein